MGIIPDSHSPLTRWQPRRQVGSCAPRPCSRHQASMTQELLSYSTQARSPPPVSTAGLSHPPRSPPLPHCSSRLSRSGRFAPISSTHAHAPSCNRENKGVLLKLEVPKLPHHTNFRGFGASRILHTKVLRYVGLVTSMNECVLKEGLDSRLFHLRFEMI